MKKLLTFLTAALIAVFAPAQPTPAQGVGRIIAGTNVTISPASGTGGAVTINSTGGGGSGTVTSVGFTGGLISVANPTSTPALTVAGTSGGVPYFSSASTWASSAALTLNALVVGGGAGSPPATVTTGTGVLTALGVNIGSAGAPVLFNGAGGTPTSLTGTNITGTATGLTAGTATNAVNSGVTDDTTTNATMYPLWMTAATGNLPIKVSSTGMTWNPSTKTLSIAGPFLSGTAASNAGALTLTQGTANSVGTTNITIEAPTSVTSWKRILPGTVGSTGYVKETVSTTTQTESVVTSIPAADIASGALANGMTATTQAQGDRSTKVATDDFASPHIDAQTGTTYTIAATDANNYLTLSNASPVTLTIPLNATTAYTDGDTIAIQQKGAGLVTVHPVSGTVTINGASSDIAFLGQYQWGTLVKVGTGTDTWAFSIGPRISVASGKTLTVSNSLTLAGTDSTTMTFPSTTATIARTDAGQTFTGVQVFTTPTITTGLTATGAGSVDFSGASSTFKLPTGGLLSPQALANRFRSNSSVSAQTPSATTRTYVTGSDIGAFTAGQIVVGTVIEWNMSITKTGAGTATSTFDIAFGTAGSTADTARVSFTKPAGVGNADTCHVKITAVVKTNSASGVVIGDFVLNDDQTNTLGGFLGAAKYASVLQVSSSTFDTTAPTHVGICITTGTSDAYTINYCTVKSWNL